MIMTCSEKLHTASIRILVVANDVLHNVEQIGTNRTGEGIHRWGLTAGATVLDCFPSVSAHNSGNADLEHS